MVGVLACHSVSAESAMGVTEASSPSLAQYNGMNPGKSEGGKAICCSLQRPRVAVR